MRIVLFGDGAWAANSLMRLYEDGHSIASVVIRTKPSDTSLEDACRKLGVPVLQPRNINAPDFLETMRSLEPDICLSISCNQIMRRPLLDTSPRGFVNFHAGSLPFYRGRNVINWAIINGEKEIGLTAHFIDEGIDTGDILLQKILPISWSDTYGDVLNRIVEAFPEFVQETVRVVSSGATVPQQQSHLVGTYYSGRADGDEWLDWSDTSLNIYNKIRAITRPGPGARTLLGDRVAVIWQASYDLSWPKYIATPGQVVGRTSDGVIVKTGDSTLLVQEVQIGDGICEKPAWAIGTRLGLNMIDTIHSLLARVDDLEKQLLRKENSHGATGSN